MNDSRSSSPLAAAGAGSVALKAAPRTGEKERLVALEGLVQQLGVATDLPEPIASLLAKIATGTGADTVAVIVTSEAWGGVAIRGFWCRDSQANVRMMEGKEGGLLPWVTKSGLPLGGTALHRDLSYRHLCQEPWEKQTVGVVPIPGGASPSGALLVARESDVAFSAEEMRFLSEVATLLAGVVQRRALAEQERQRLLDLVTALSAALDARDPSTRGHSERVALYALAILNELEREREERFPDDMRHSVLLAGFLHDVGKIGIADDILLKKDKLTAQEYALMKEHPLKGARILGPVQGMEDVCALIQLHHERLDGSGYPKGLSGDQIPLGAQVIALADAFDAITSVRSYSEGISDEEAMGILTPLAGRLFSQEIVEALLRAHRAGVLADRLAQTAAGTPAAELPASGDAFAILGNPDKLPALPKVVHLVLQKLQEPGVAPYDVVDVVSSDQTLVSQILKQVNSAFYGLSRRISSVQQAMTVLGIVALKHLVLEVGVAQVFRTAPAASRREMEALWRHSLLCSRAARRLVPRNEPARAQESSTAGILHDIGRLAMIHGLGERWNAFVPTAGDWQRPPTREDEQAAFGLDHCRVGVWLAEKWKLPEQLVAAIGRHHDPGGSEQGEAPMAPLAEIVQIADWAAWQCVRSSGVDAAPGEFWRELPPGAAKYGLTVENARAFIQELRGEPELEALLSERTPSPGDPGGEPSRARR